MIPSDPNTEKVIDHEMMVHRALWVARYLVECIRTFQFVRTDEKYIREYIRCNVQ